MFKQPASHTDLDKPLAYQIRLKGHLDAEWADWFGDLTITNEENSETLLASPALDQAALHGVLKKVRDLGMLLVSINPIQPDPTDGPEIRGTHLRHPRKENRMNTINRTARQVGGLYLTYIVIGILADVFGRSRFIVDGDAATTATNIAAHAWQFRAGFVGDLIAAVLFFLTAWALYVLLKPVNKNLAVLFLLLNLGGVAVQCMNDLNLLAALLLSSGADYLNVFQANQLQALALAFLNLYKQGFWICQIFFGAWLFPLGYLIFKSGFLPRVLGIIFMVHCVGWLMTFGQYFLFPGYDFITYVTYPLGFIAEFGLSLWLLIKGVNIEQWNRRALEAA